MTTSICLSKTKTFDVLSGQVTETYTGSLLFMRQLTVVAVSTMTLLRGAFSEDNYTIDRFAGLNLQVLKYQCEDELAQFLITALGQAFEALEKKYLSELRVCFVDERGAPLGAHALRYTYGGGEGEGAAGGIAAVRDATQRLIRAVTSAAGGGALPDAYDLTVRLYYNDTAPVGYQAPGYAALAGAAEGAGEGEGEEEGGAGGGVWLGDVRTRFHRVRLRALPAAPRDRPPATQHSREANPSQTSPHMTQDFEDCPDADDGREGPVVVTDGAGDVAVADDVIVTGSDTSDVTGDAVIACACQQADAEPDTPLLQCRVCGRWQHAVCYGWLRGGGGVKGGHRCAQCAPDLFANCGFNNLKCLAMFRRALQWVRGACAGGAGEAGGLAGGLAALRARLRLSERSAARLAALLAHRQVITHSSAAGGERLCVLADGLARALADFFIDTTPPPHQPHHQPAARGHGQEVEPWPRAEAGEGEGERPPAPPPRTRPRPRTTTAPAPPTPAKKKRLRK